MSGQKQKVCLAYSGGLDTSCILKYFLVSYGAYPSIGDNRLTLE